MQYRWDDYCLDRQRILLTLRGEQIHVSRKILDCITHLVEHRDRVVIYDELILAIWGHDNVTNHQLAQVVVAARRVVGDDGQAQKVIRTMPGHGYRWIGEIAVDDGNAQKSEVSMMIDVPVRDRGSAPLPPHETHSGVDPVPSEVRGQNRRRRLSLTMIVGLLIASILTWRFVLSDVKPATEAVPRSVVIDLFTQIEELIWRADTDAARDILAGLPRHLANSERAQILEIQMNIAQGRTDLARKKLERLHGEYGSTTDPARKSRLLRLQSMLAIDPSHKLAPAEEAVFLLESLGEAAPEIEMGEALLVRAAAHHNEWNPDLAIRDYIKSRDLFLSIGDKRRAVTAARGLAQVWLKMRLLRKSLEELNKSAEASAALDDKTGEVISRTFAARIQIEMIHWDEALINGRRNFEITKGFSDSLRHDTALNLYVVALANVGRLREAGMLVEQTSSHDPSQTPSVFRALYLLNAGDAESALADAARLFNTYDESDSTNLLLQNREGALLLWVIAAGAISDTGGGIPTPSPAQTDALQRPASVPGRIARGRWLAMQGSRIEAKAELRSAFEEARNMDRLWYMTFAAETLIDMMIAENDVAGADHILTIMRATDPEHMDRDYRACLSKLKVAVARGDSTLADAAYRDAIILAGERGLPQAILAEYRVLSKGARRSNAI